MYTVVTVGLGDPVNWCWIVRVTGLEAMPIVKQLSDTKSVCASLVSVDQSSQKEWGEVNHTQTLVQTEASLNLSPHLDG